MKPRGSSQRRPSRDAAGSPHVAQLTSAHPPSDSRIFERYCRSLAREGFRVTLIAPAKGRTWSGEQDGVRLVTFAPARRRVLRALVTPWVVFRLARRERASIYHFHDPELIPVGVALRLFGHVVVYDVHEDTPAQALGKTTVPPLVRLPLAAAAWVLERVAATCMSAIVTATPHIARSFPPRRRIAVQNFSVEEDVAEPRPSRHGGSRTVAYVGEISDLRGAQVMLDAATLLAARRDCRLVLAGNVVSPELVGRMADNDAVEYLGILDRAGVNDVLAGADIGLILFQRAPNHVHSQPRKLFEYMAAGLPVVASRFPLWQSIIDGAECGLTVDETDARAVAAAVETILDDPAMADAMSKKAVVAAETLYSWSAESRKLVELYHRLLASA